MILVFFGLIATGKSTVASAWAARHGYAHFNSDRIRKELAGMLPGAGCMETLDKGIYSKEFSRRTYDLLLAKAEQECLADRPVVLDASFQYRADRDRVRSLASRLGVDLLFILCNCSEDLIMKRLIRRSQDAEAVSDGNPAIYLAQKERFELPDELAGEILVNLSTAGNINELLDHLDKILVNNQVDRKN